MAPRRQRWQPLPSGLAGILTRCAGQSLSAGPRAARQQLAHVMRRRRPGCAGAQENSRLQKPARSSRSRSRRSLPCSTCVCPFRRGRGRSLLYRAGGHANHRVRGNRRDRGCVQCHRHHFHQQKPSQAAPQRRSRRSTLRAGVHAESSCRGYGCATARAAEQQDEMRS